MTFSIQDVFASAPLTVISLAAVIVLVVESLSDKTERLNCWLTIIGLLAAIAAALASLDSSGTAYNEMLATGGYANYFSVVFCLAGLLTVMLSPSYIKKESIGHGEYYSMVLFAVAGMMLMAAAADLITFFLGLELMSISFYVMAGFARKRIISNEAALKYFLLGAFATGFLLYGIALLYGATGTTNLAVIATGIALFSTNILFIVGLGLLMVGLVFKVAAVPFHMWVPDVYEGSPTTVSGFMSTGGKAAAFSAFLLIFSPALVTVMGSVREVLAVLAALSMVVGNIFAIAQSNIKRMLAYSSIAHAGYILTGIVAANSLGSNGVLFYLMAYTAMNVGAFGVLSILESNDGGNLTFDDYTGLSTKRPALAALMALFMFSLLGIPPFAGFFGKYYVFAGAIQGGYTWLAIVGVLMSVVSAYYYLRLVVLMYFKEQVSVIEAVVPNLGLTALVISAIVLFVFGIYPSAIISVTSHFF
ncbi:MAG: NADH-quinone oxidoreductase subunit N [Bacteroidota bacterium]